MPLFPYRLPDGNIESEPAAWPKIRDFAGGMWVTYNKGPNFESQPAVPSPCNALLGKTDVSILGYSKTNVQNHFSNKWQYFIRHATSAVRDFQYESECALMLNKEPHKCSVMRYEPVANKIIGLAAYSDQVDLQDTAKNQLCIYVKVNCEQQKTKDYLP